MTRRHRSPCLREQASGEPPGPLGPRTQKGDSIGRYQWRVCAPCPPPDLAPAIVGDSRSRDANSALIWRMPNVSGCGYEEAMFKADLMNLRRRWLDVDPGAFAVRLREEGMRDDDVAELVGWLKRAQAGRRLVPQRGYRQFQFNPPPEAPQPNPIQTSRSW